MTKKQLQARVKKLEKIILKQVAVEEELQTNNNILGDRLDIARQATITLDAIGDIFSQLTIPRTGFNDNKPILERIERWVKIRRHERDTIKISMKKLKSVARGLAMQLWGPREAKEKLEFIFDGSVQDERKSDA